MMVSTSIKEFYESKQLDSYFLEKKSADTLIDVVFILRAFALHKF